jgi:hypothetical protein
LGFRVYNAFVPGIIDSLTVGLYTSDGEKALSFDEKKERGQLVFGISQLSKAKRVRRDSDAS